MVFYYDRKGQPIDLFQFGRLCRDLSYVRVAETFVGESRVSVVWLGIDHAFGTAMPGVPIAIFELMIFSMDPAIDGFMNRYPSEAAAIADHDQKVAALREGRSIE